MTPEQLAKSGTESAHQRAVSRKEAKKLGIPRYSGKPCVKCGGVTRYTASCVCVPCHNEKEKVSYYHNREKRLNYNRKRWSDNSEKLNVLRRKSRSKNPQKFRDTAKKWRKENPDKVNKYNANHKEYREILTKRWRINNPEKHKRNVKAGWQNRRARERKIGGKISSKIIAKLLICQNNACYYCFEGFENYYEIEHIIPLSRGGTNEEINICLACRACNAQKGTKLIDEWYNTKTCRSKRNVNT